MKNFGKLINWLPLFLLAWLGIGQTIYLFVFQQSAQISLRRLMVSFLIAGVIVFAEAALLWRERINFLKYGHLFLFAVLLSLVLIFVISIPNNYLFAPQVDLNLSYENGTEQDQQLLITWINNGISDMRYQDLVLSDGSYADQAGIHLLAPPNGIARLDWSGRAWEKIGVEVRDPFEGSLKVVTNQIKNQYAFDQFKQNGGVIYLAVQSVVFDLLLKILVVLGFVFIIHFVLVLLVVIYPLFEKIIHPLLLFVDQKIKFEWVLVTILSVFLVLIGFWVWTSFFNQFYADDYCYQMRYDQNGWLGASWDAYHNLNGRFMGHVVNFAFFGLRNGTAKVGVLSAFIGLFCGLSFLFFTLLREVEKRMRFMLSACSAAAVFGFVYLWVPDLYESLFWTLSAVLLTSGFVILLFSLGWAGKQFNQPEANNQLFRFVLFFVLGAASTGFIEAESVVIILISSAAVGLFWLFRKGNKQSEIWKQFLSYPIGAIVGLLMVLFSPGNQSRISDMGAGGGTFSVLEVLDRYVRLLFANIESLVYGYGILLLVLVMVAFFIGNNIRKEVFPCFAALSQPLKILFFIMPYLFFAAAFLPSAFVFGYFPERTMLVPIFALVLGNFLVFFYLGNQTRPLLGMNKLFPILLTALWVVLLWKPQSDFSKQLRLFAAEWQARETYILEAVASGKTQVEVTPYQYGMGTDLFNQQGDWLDLCLDEYYGIDLTIPKKTAP